MKLPYVIGLTGLKRAGKDSVALHLCEHHGFLTFSWAHPIRQMVRALGVPEEYITGERKEDPIPGFGVSGRFLMQTLGVEWGRELVSNSIWIKALCQNPAFQEALTRRPIVLTDCRMDNEAQAVIEMGGKIWEVRRPGCVSDGHATELGITPRYIARTLYNEGTLLNLAEQIDDLL